MKVLSVSRQNTEIVREKLNRRSLLIGRSPACDIVVRGPSVKPVHYLLEWFGSDTFDPDTGHWALLDLSEAQGSRSKKANLTGEAILLGSEKSNVLGFQFEIVEDKLAESDLRRGVIKRGLTKDDEGVSYIKKYSVLEIVQYRSDIDTVSGIRHYPFSTLGSPIFFEPSNLFSVQKDPSSETVQLRNSYGVSDAQVFLRGVDVTEKVRDKNQVLKINPGELYLIVTPNNEFFIRLVTEVQVAFDDMASFKDPTLVTFFFVCILLCATSFWMWLSPHEEPVIDKTPPRIATVEVKDVSPPTPEPPLPPKAVEAVEPPRQQPTETPKAMMEMKTESQATAKSAVGAAPIVKNAETGSKAGLNSPAPVQDVNRVGLLGKLGGGKKSIQKVSADMVLNQGVVSDTVSGDSGFAVEKPPMGEIGTGKTGGSSKEGPGLVAAGTTLKNSEMGNLKSAGAIGVKGGSEKFSIGQSLSGNTGIAGEKTKALDGSGDGEQVLGGLDREAVRRALAENKRAIRNCYEVALLSRKDLEGKMTFKWKIHAEGHVETISLAKSEVGLPSFEECVQKVVRGIMFPKAPNKQPTTVIYPFVFQGKK